MPKPPKIKNAQLISGISGFMFGGSPLNKVDLWVMGDDGAYWYNAEHQDWEEFKVHGRKPEALSSLTTSSETVGYSIIRLSILDGRLLQQKPEDGTRIVYWLFGIPASGIVGLLLVRVSFYFRHKIAT